MHQSIRHGARVIVLGLGIAAGAPPRPAGAPDGQAPAAQERSSPKRLVAAAPFAINFHPNDTSPGVPDVRTMVHPGVSVADDTGGQRAILVDAVPSLENGLWKLLPDGRMETTFKVRPNARWHDDTPFTSADLVFTAQLSQDRTLAGFSQTVWNSVEAVTAPDAQTAVVTWRRPFVQAHQLFSMTWATPVPKHLVEPTYLQDKSLLADLPLWTTEFVGAGPYKLREYVPGQTVFLEAFAQYPLGRPKVDEIEIRYIPDPNVIITNAIAGAVDFTLGQRIPLDTALEVKEQWKDGTFTFEFADHRAFQMFPQFLNPTPAIVGDVRFRKAAIHALNRQEIVDTLAGGKSFIMHTYMAPNQPEYRDVEARVPKYEYDPRRSVQLIEELGYRRGSDEVFRDATGQRLEVEFMGAAAVTKILPVLASYMQRVGVAAYTTDVPPQRQEEWSYRAPFSAFQVLNPFVDVLGLPTLHSSRTRLAENNWAIGGGANWSRHRNPEFDTLIERFQAAIPIPERHQALSEILNYLAENVVIIGLYYNPVPYAISNRVVNIPMNRGSNSSIAWNIHEWDVR
jgi:peptide/nickel transport system substrate-binding protein